MAIVDSRVNEQTIGTLVADAYRMASLLGDQQTLDNHRLQKGMRALERIVKSPAFNGCMPKVVAPELIDIDADDGTYSLPAYVIAPFGEGSFHLDDETQENRVTELTRQQYQAIGDKSTTGRPYQYFADRTTDPVTLWLYPVPDADGTLRLQVQRLRADVTDSTATLELERHWARGVTWTLAQELALAAGLPLNRVRYIGEEAKVEVRQAFGESSQTASVSARIDHPTPWSR